jgi:hypothetical protein
MDLEIHTQTGPLQLTDADMRIPHIINSQKWYSFRRWLQLRGSSGSLVGWGIKTTSALLPIRCLRPEVPCTRTVSIVQSQGRGMAHLICRYLLQGGELTVDQMHRPWDHLNAFPEFERALLYKVLGIVHDAKLYEAVSLLLSRRYEGIANHGTVELWKKLNTSLVGAQSDLEVSRGMSGEVAAIRLGATTKRSHH